jgi:hypothetical protein
MPGMKTIVHSAIGGVIAAAIMVVLRLLLSQQAALVGQYHYPVFDLVGQEGLARLMTIAAFGAAYGAAYGLLLKDILPGGFIIGPLAFGCVPTLVDALVVPLRAGSGAIKDPWILLWMYAHWVFFSLCLIFIVGSKGSKGGKKRSAEED